MIDSHDLCISAPAFTVYYLGSLVGKLFTTCNTGFFNVRMTSSCDEYIVYVVCIHSVLVMSLQDALCIELKV